MKRKYFYKKLHKIRNLFIIFIYIKSKYIGIFLNKILVFEKKAKIIRKSIRKNKKVSKKIIKKQTKKMV